MKKIKWFACLVIPVLLLSLVAPVAAAPPADNPGKGPPELEKVVFIHYGKNFAPGKPSGTPGKGPDSKEKTDELYSYSRVHWTDADIPVYYWINPANSPVANADAITGITAAFQTWENDPLSYLDFEYSGTTTTIAPGVYSNSPDYQNVVGWAYLSADYPDAIGITIAWYLRGKKLIVDCDTALNTDSFFAWTQTDIGTADPDSQILYDTPAYDVDLQNIMTHEAGHWLQLDDLYYDAAAEQTMYGLADEGELKKRSLESGDIDGVQKIYPGAEK
ncbi:hypothetical protein ACFLV3_04405 [Chloroflexota bacterium]